MSPVQRNKFFPKMSYGASRDWINITAGQQPIETWVSGAIVLQRSVDADAVLLMAEKFLLRPEVLADHRDSIEDPGRLFVRDAAIQMAGEVSKAGFLARAGKLCAVELSASATLERLLQEVFADYLPSVSDKMKTWKTTAGANAELAPARQ
jgi:hypothetical protein